MTLDESLAAFRARVGPAFSLTANEIRLKLLGLLLFATSTSMARAVGLGGPPNPHPSEGTESPSRSEGPWEALLPGPHAALRFLLSVDAGVPSEQLLCNIESAASCHILRCAQLLTCDLIRNFVSAMFYGSRWTV